MTVLQRLTTYHLGPHATDHDLPRFIREVERHLDVRDVRVHAPGNVVLTIWTRATDCDAAYSHVDDVLDRLLTQWSLSC